MQCNVPAALCPHPVHKRLPYILDIFGKAESLKTGHEQDMIPIRWQGGVCLSATHLMLK